MNKIMNKMDKKFKEITLPWIGPDSSIYNIKDWFGFGLCMLYIFLVTMLVMSPIIGIVMLIQYL